MLCLMQRSTILINFHTCSILKKDALCYHEGMKANDADCFKEAMGNEYLVSTKKRHIK